MCNYSQSVHVYMFNLSMRTSLNAKSACSKLQLLSTHVFTSINKPDMSTVMHITLSYDRATDCNMCGCYLANLSLVVDEEWAFDTVLVGKLLLVIEYPHLISRSHVSAVWFVNSNK